MTDRQEHVSSGRMRQPHDRTWEEPTLSWAAGSTDRHWSPLGRTETLGDVALFDRRRTRSNGGRVSVRPVRPGGTNTSFAIGEGCHAPERTKS